LVPKLGGNWDLVFGKTGDEKIKKVAIKTAHREKEKKGPNGFSHLNWSSPQDRSFTPSFGFCLTCTLSPSLLFI
jgi:hypothetical protein